MPSRTCRTVDAGVVASAITTALPGAAAAVAGADPTGAAAPSAGSTRVATEPESKTCYSSLDGEEIVAITSQNFESALDSFDVLLTDDATIGKRTCKVKSITVVGEYYNGLGGPADSETVTFYKNSKKSPGKVVDSQTVVGADNGLGTFDIALDTVTLKARTT